MSKNRTLVVLRLRILGSRLIVWSRLISLQLLALIIFQTSTNYKDRQHDYCQLFYIMKNRDHYNVKHMKRTANHFLLYGR
ncbi:hypothetical protein EG68_09480 [Paragonimus skrjabini miyazakii]|uniref:Uncharacterized protein n=1 Tax=Paragonimus skrjabini miyazakii TaxID=59628 RepID=A0A8S9YTQ8_9TREM|nr:hypothetical protein EG68_09480 [Paragonimus skrjabini miyazakii]